MAARAAQGRPRERQPVPAVEPDAARVRRFQARDQPAARRLAAARLSDETQDLAMPDGEIDAR
jgi:hypothetical protein